MLADPLREALCERQEESAVIDTPLQKGARGFWCAGFDYYWSPEQDYAPLPGSLRFELFGISEELPWPRFRLDAGADFGTVGCWMGGREECWVRAVLDFGCRDCGIFRMDVISFAIGWPSVGPTDFCQMKDAGIPCRE